MGCPRVGFRAGERDQERQAGHGGYAGAVRAGRGHAAGAGAEHARRAVNFSTNSL